MEIIKTLDEYNRLIETDHTHIFFCSLSFCLPCKVINPQYELMAKDNVNKELKFYKLVVDEFDDEEESKIKDILKLHGKKFPLFVFIKNKDILYELEGKQYNELQNIINFIL